MTNPVRNAEKEEGEREYSREGEGPGVYRLEGRGDEWEEMLMVERAEGEGGGRR